MVQILVLLIAVCLIIGIGACMVSLVWAIDLDNDVHNYCYKAFIFGLIAYGIAILAFFILILPIVLKHIYLL